MADRWVKDKTTDSTSPFNLRRDILDIIEVSGGGGGGDVTQEEFDALEARVDTTEATDVNLDARLDALEAAGQPFDVLGHTTGTSTYDPAGWPTSGNNKFGVRVVAGSAGTISDLQVYLLENAGHGGQSQYIRGLLYQGNDAAAGLLSTGTQTSITGGALDRWVTLPGTYTFPSAGVYILAVQPESGISVNQVGAFAADVAAAGSGCLSNSDAYTGGAADPYGSLFEYPFVISLKGTFVASAAAPGVDIADDGISVGQATTINFIGGTVAYDAVTDTASVETSATAPEDNQVIVGSSAADSGFIELPFPSVQLYSETNGTIEAGATFVGDLFSGGQIISTVRSTHADSMTLSDSADGTTMQELDGTTLTARASLYTANLRTATSRPYTRTTVVVGGTASTVEVERAVTSSS